MVKEFIKKVVDSIGYKIVKNSDMDQASFGLDQGFLDISKLCKLYTQLSTERLFALYQSVNYLIRNKVEGDFVQCGVWKGGSVMLAIWAAMEFKEFSSEFYLYDTFEGMSEPTVKDTWAYNGKSAHEKWQSMQDKGESWNYSSIEEVKKNVFSTTYPEGNFIFVKGKVEETIPARMPDKISLLYLDTDWYASTLHELVHLYPRLSPGGVMIVDDYGDFSGAREAVDQYFRERGLAPLLNRIDHTGRLIIKL
jgi:hypothetical protein